MSEPRKNEAGELSVWAIAGNIVEERPFGPGGEEVRHGTRLFRAGAKVYLGSLDDSHVLFHPENDFERIQVVGQHRNSRKWIMAWTYHKWVTNWRVQLVYQPAALRRLEQAGWPGFLLKESEFNCPESDRSSKQAFEDLIAAIVAHAKDRRWLKRRPQAATVRDKAGSK